MAGSWLVGRDSEVALLRGLVARVAAGTGGVVLVEGEEGSGRRLCAVRPVVLTTGAGLAACQALASCDAALRGGWRQHGRVESCWWTASMT